MVGASVLRALEARCEAHERLTLEREDLVLRDLARRAAALPGSAHDADGIETRGHVEETRERVGFSVS